MIALAVVGLLAVSGLAIASEGDPDDTVGNYHYDAVNDFLFWNVTSLENQSVNYDLLYAALLDDCTLDDGPYTYSYNGDAITLTPPVADNCAALTGGFVYGPNFQINHGSVMKLVNSLMDGAQGRGCVIREFARSGVGKDDKQMADSEFIAPDPATEAIGSNSVEFVTFETNCLHGKKGEGEGVSAGPPAHVLEKKATKAAEKWPEGKPGKGPKNGD